MRDEPRTTTQTRRCKAEGRLAREAAGGHGERRAGGGEGGRRMRGRREEGETIGGGAGTACGTAKMKKNEY